MALIKDLNPIFHHLKHTYIIGKQKKLHMEGFLWQPSSQKFPSDHSEMDTKYAGARWVQTINFFLSQNHIENLIPIILSRFSINETQE